MKKFLAGLLAIVMLLSLAACANTNPSDGTHVPGETVQGNDNKPSDERPTSSADSDNAAGYKWETKDVTMPEFATMEEIKLTVVEGRDTQARVVVSPWQIGDFDMEAAKTALKNSYLFDGWVFGTEAVERGNVTNYKEIGQLTSYEWDKKIVAIKEYYDTATYASDISLTFSGDTQTIQGYEQILLEINIPEEEITKEIQDEVYKLLQVIFGEKYAEVLCYGPIVKDNLIFEDEQDNGVIYLRRNISKYGMTFNMHMRSYRANWAFDSFPGDGSYESVAGQPKYVYGMLDESIGAVDIKDFKNIGAELLKQVFPGYTHTTPDYDAYYVRYMELENGHNVESFEVEGNIATEDLSGTAAPNLIIDYDVVHNGTDITDVEMTFECGVGQTYGDADLEATRNTFFANGVKAFDILLKDDINAAEAIVKGEDGKHQSYQYKTNVFGLEKDASISFVLGETMMGTLVGYIYFNIR